MCQMYFFLSCGVPGDFGVENNFEVFNCGEP